MRRTVLDLLRDRRSNDWSSVEHCGTWKCIRQEHLAMWCSRHLSLHSELNRIEVQVEGWLFILLHLEVVRHLHFGGHLPSVMEHRHRVRWSDVDSDSCVCPQYIRWIIHVNIQLLGVYQTDPNWACCLLHCVDWVDNHDGWSASWESRREIG